MKGKKTVFYITAGMALVLIVLIGMQYERRQQIQREIADKILRFHVLANSDTKEDQELKLEVRDAVGAAVGKMLFGVGDRGSCESVILDQIEVIQETAEEVISEAGYNYGVKTYLADVDFPVKTYGNYTFPAGRYRALRVVIGEGAGQNWWCVMYPNMCFSGSVYEVIEEDARESLKEVLSPEEYEAVLQNGDYKVQFKYLKFLNGLSKGNTD